MPLFSSPRPAPLASAERTLPWRKNDYLAYSVGQDQQAVLVRGAAPVVLPGFVVDFIAACDSFRPLEAQLASHAEKHAWGTLEIEALRSWLPRAIAARVLVSSADLLAACTAQAPTPPPLTTLGFPTGGDRVDLVGRALGSFAANARTHGRAVDFLVADSSASPVQRAAFRAASRAWAQEHGVPVRYAGEEEKRRLADALIARGLPPEEIEFALFDPLGLGFACGANRNALLLHQVGQMFCSIDDDVICQLAAAPPCTAKLRVFSSCDPFSRWLFADREAALAHATWVERDFLATHEALLGRGLGDLAAGLSPTDLDVEHAGDEVLRRLWPGTARVRASFSGHLGDPGIPTSCYFLFYEGENRRRLTASEAHYRAVLGSRSVCALAPCPAVGDASTSPGMAMGLDHRELLPPFFPVLHAEDFIYGATLWQCDGQACLAHSPFAVRHEPRPGKTILRPGDLGPEQRAVVFEFAHLLRRVILRCRRSESDAPSARMRQLGTHLVAIANQPLADFTETLRGQLLEMESAKLDHLDQELREDDETPAFWRGDLEAYLNHVREALTHDDFDIPYDLKGARSAAENRALMQQLFARYGRLLLAWPDIVAAATEVNAQSEWMS
jgi:hypothetical protein